MHELADRAIACILTCNEEIFLKDVLHYSVRSFQGPFHEFTCFKLNIHNEHEKIPFQILEGVNTSKYFWDALPDGVILFGGPL